MMTVNTTVLKNHVLSKLLSRLGHRIFFPEGIIAQTEQSMNAKIKATAGMSYVQGKLGYLPEVMSHNFLSEFTPEEVLAYAPVAGLPQLREEWKRALKVKNPSLDETKISTPIVTPGLTNGVSGILHLMLDAEDELISPDCLWENYEHIAHVVIGAKLNTFPMFNKAGGFNTEGLKEKLEKNLAEKKKSVILFNFPNNPTGYSVLKSEVDVISELIYYYADQGMPIMTITDDAYFGLFYEDDIYQESLFSVFSKLHENVFAAKIDGATKEMLVWGLRVGCITFGCKDISEDIIRVLEQKIVAFIRATATSTSRLSQTLVLKALKNDSLTQSVYVHKGDLHNRYLELKKSIDIVKRKYPHTSVVDVPFNSGYFASFGFNDSKEALAIRNKILQEENIALIAIEDKIRFAYSCVNLDQILQVIDIIYKYATQMQGK